MGESDPGSSGEHGKAKAGSEHSVGFCHCVLLKRRGQSRDLLSWEKKKIRPGHTSGRGDTCSGQEGVNESY